MTLNDEITEIERELKKKGISNIITDETELESYSYDRSFKKMKPRMVILPESKKEIIEIVRTANKHRVRVTPRGSGTSIAGSSIPCDNSITVQMSKMNRIIDLNLESGILTCEAGLFYAMINDRLKNSNRRFPLRIILGRSKTIGGMIGDGVHGLDDLAAGGLARNILEVKMISGSGEDITVRGDEELIDFIVGSRGILGIVYQVRINLPELYEDKFSVSAEVESVEDAAKISHKILESNIKVYSLEYLGQYAANFMSERLGFEPPTGQAYILIESNPSDIEKITQILYGEHVIDVNIGPLDPPWQMRLELERELCRVGNLAMQTKVKIPINSISDFCRKIERLAGDFRLKILNYGHIHNGIFYPTILVEETDEKTKSRARDGLEKIYRVAVSMWGEKALAYSKEKGYWSWIASGVSPEKCDRYIHLKSKMDPGGILCPKELTH